MLMDTVSFNFGRMSTKAALREGKLGPGDAWHRPAPSPIHGAGQTVVTGLAYGTIVLRISLKGPRLPRAFCQAPLMYAVLPRSDSSKRRVWEGRLAIV